MRKVLSLIIGMLFIFTCTASVVAQHSSGQVGIFINDGLIKLVGGSADHSMINHLGSFVLKYSYSQKLTSEISVGLGWVRPRDPDSHFKSDPTAPYRTYLYPWSVSFRYNLIHGKWIAPYIGVGAGLTHWDLRDVSEEDEWMPIPHSGESIHDLKNNLTLIGTTGLSLFITPSFGLDLSIRYSHLLIQRLDNIGTGDVNTGLLEARIGLGFYIGGYRDSDGDGIEDKKDGAPKQPEDFDFFQDEDGIPDLDNDNDGIPDEMDQGPNLPEDHDGFQDDDGLPDVDNDNDGIEDAEDQCPMQPEDFDGFQDDDGCPDPDNDNDGIPDLQDQCPNQAENFNGFEDDDGCPDEKPETPLDVIGKPLVLTGVTFATGKADLTENAKIVLNTVIEALRDNPDVRVEIRGYTDDTGSAATNLTLSQRRAESVRNFLIFRGVDTARMRAIGFGESNPIDTNSTPEGRARNRRIEFVRVEN